jgi:hypothetical protein
VPTRTHHIMGLLVHYMSPSMYVYVCTNVLYVLQTSQKRLFSEETFPTVLTGLVVVIAAGQFCVQNGRHPVGVPCQECRPAGRLQDRRPAAATCTHKMVQYAMDGTRSTFYQSSRQAMRFAAATTRDLKVVAAKIRLCSRLLW